MIQKEEIKAVLLDAGCSVEETENILHCLHQNDCKEAQKLIDLCRRKQLKKVHEDQKRIDKLDYLIYEMKQDKHI